MEVRPVRWCARARPGELAFRRGARAWDTADESDHGAYEGMTPDQIQAVRPGWSICGRGARGEERGGRHRARADGVVAWAREAERDVPALAHGHVRWWAIGARVAGAAGVVRGADTAESRRRCRCWVGVAGEPVVESWNDVGTSSADGWCRCRVLAGACVGLAGWGAARRCGCRCAHSCCPSGHDCPQLGGGWLRRSRQRSVAVHRGRWRRMGSGGGEEDRPCPPASCGCARLHLKPSRSRDPHPAPCRLVGAPARPGRPKLACRVQRARFRVKCGS